MASIEQIEIAHFLSQHEPFKRLDKPDVNALAAQIEVSYFRAEKDILILGEPIRDLYVIRSGAVETYRRSGELYNRLTTGEVFGHTGLLLNRRVRFPVRAIEDTLVYCIPEQAFNDLCDEYEEFADFFDVAEGAQLRQAVSSHENNNRLTTVKVSALLSKDPVFVSLDASITEAAELMSQENVSSLLIVNHKVSHSSDAEVVGIITDTDFRLKVIAEGKSPNEPVSSIMSTALVRLSSSSFVYEAMLMMLRHHVQYLPVMHDNRPVGVLSLSDVLLHESQSSVLFVKGIFDQDSVDDLQSYANHIPNVFVRMVNEGANSKTIGNAMSLIGRSIKQRLLQLAEEKFGSAPVDYCFLALGSMARGEQLLATDQDNALILGNDYIDSEHAAYFNELAQFVCDGLNQCGYPLCTGNIMATNPKWRLTLKEWQDTFQEWIDNPTPEALLNCSIFFDLEGVWGNVSWSKKLHAFISNHSKNKSKFLSLLARNSLLRTPPLGFFKHFVMESDGKHNKTINLKRRGTAPLTDVIRVHALSIGSRANNSFERLEDIEKSDILPPNKAQDLSDALEYISMVRIKHQAKDIESNQEPDNNIEPEMLSSFEKRNLKEAFQVLNNAQNYLKFHFSSSPKLT